MRNQILGTAVLFGTSMLQPIAGNVQQGSIDAVIAAPASHTVVLENSRVRVLQVTIQPGVTEPVHTHEWPSIMQVEAPQPLTYITYSEQGGKWIETQRFNVPAGKPTKAQWMKPEGPHAVQNRGTSEYRAVRIELKPNSANTDQ